MYGSPHATNIVFNVCYYYVEQWLTLLVMQQVIPIHTSQQWQLSEISGDVW